MLGGLDRGTSRLSNAALEGPIGEHGTVTSIPTGEQPMSAATVL